MRGTAFIIEESNYFLQRARQLRRRCVVRRTDGDLRLEKEDR
jgi:hypothetical protein